MDIHLIWAQDKNKGIGANGKLPWHIPEDLKNFKKITSDSIIIMGRKTWESLPIKPLPNRRNIVLSKTKNMKIENFNSYEECIAKLKLENVDKIFIIGGRSIYNLFYSKANFLHITTIHLLNAEVNEYFPINMDDIKNDFRKINTTKLSSKATYAFWEKKSINKIY